MIKKIPTAQLRLGMFIHDLNAGWMTHGFWRQSFMLSKDEDLAKIQTSTIAEVYIDTLRGLDCETESGATADLAFRANLSAGRIDVPTPVIHASHKEEIGRALAIQKEATQVVTTMLDDVRLGKQIELERLEPVVGKITDSIVRNPGALLSLSRLKERDSYTFEHSLSVATLMITFARSLGLDPAKVQLAGLGGMVHDVGKMRIPDEVLNKPGRLTDNEFHVMKSHVLLGLRILESTPGLTAETYEIAGQHHERYSGTGYPDGLRGFEINLFGRMAAIVDTYDAMTANRVYQSGTEPSIVLRKLFEWGGDFFEQDLVQAFIHTVGIYPAGSLVRLDNGLLAVVLDQNPENRLSPIVRTVMDAKQRRLVAPKELDLSLVSEGPRILGAEDPHDWGLDIRALLSP